MRILQVCNIYYPELQFGGPPAKIHALSRGLLARGHEVKVLTFRSNERRWREVRKFDNVPVQYLPWRGKGLYQIPMAFKEIREAVRDTDLIHCYGLYDLLCPIVEHYARQFKRPYVIEPMGMFVARSGHVHVKRLYHRFITSRAARDAAAVIATSPAELLELKLLRTRRLVLRRNGLEIEKFENLPRTEKFRKRFGASNTAKLVLFVGRISPIKNLEMLIKAFDRADVPESVLVLAGPAREADYLERLKSLVRERALGGRVVFIGPVFDSDHLEALAAATLFVLPSLSESFGNAAAEAVVAGVPVLLTDGCGIAPLIDGRAGLSVRCTEEAIAQGLRSLLLNPEIRRQATSGRREVVKELSWEEPLNETVALYRELICGRNN